MPCFVEVLRTSSLAMSAGPPSMRVERTAAANTAVRMLESGVSVSGRVHAALSRSSISGGRAACFAARSSAGLHDGVPLNGASCADPARAIATSRALGSARWLVAT